MRDFMVTVYLNNHPTKHCIIGFSDSETPIIIESGTLVMCHQSRDPLSSDLYFVPMANVAHIDVERRIE